MSAKDIVIASAMRTAVGSFNGKFANTPAHDLGATAITAALAAANVAAADVDEVILGQILGAAQGQNPARQAAMKAGVPQEKTAFGLNQLCGSGLRAVALGMQQIANGDADVIVAGGIESMSMAPHAAHLRGGQKMGDMKFIDTMLKDGLMDAFHGYHMGNTAENVAAKWQISREDQDRFAAASQNKAEAAQKAGRFKDEIAPFKIVTKKGEDIVLDDEFIRHGVTYDALAKLKAAFSKDGSVTAGNASGINDGAAALVLMTAAEAEKRGVTPMARIVSWATAGVDPAVMAQARSPRRARRSPRPVGRSRSSTSWRPTKLSPRRRWRSTKTSAGTPTSSTSTAARSPSATRSAPRAPACSSRCCTRWRGAARKRVSRRFASAAAWASL